MVGNGGGDGGENGGGFGEGVVEEMVVEMEEWWPAKGVGCCFCFQETKKKKE